MDNVIIHNCETNGKFIRILGNGNNIEIKNSLVTKNISYGPLININSQNVK